MGVCGRRDAGRACWPQHLSIVLQRVPLLFSAHGMRALLSCQLRPPLGGRCSTGATGSMSKLHTASARAESLQSEVSKAGGRRERH